MALYVKLCECGNEFEVLTTIKHSDLCPLCGSANTHNTLQPVANFVYTQISNSHDANLIHQSHMRRKKQLDVRSDEIKTGELDLKLQGPKEYWPDVTKEKNLH
jgi:hypothetical protein